MTRITTPEATRGPAPSHSPPDVRYAPNIGLARALGWFSIGLGLAEVLAPRAVSAATGVRNVTLLQAFGVREMACGLGILSCRRPAGWMWGRVAGDAMDLATLGSVLVEADGDRRRRALVATAAVAGVTVLDVLCGATLGAAAALEG